jgi:apolipoprotein D and lipocalin family protein
MNTTNKSLLLALSLISITAMLTSCASIPKKATPVQPFDLDRYLGSWYEIARMDFRQERGLNNVSAQYSLKENGDVAVLNSGFNVEEAKWEKAEAKAKFRGDESKGALKVSFFGPFYSGYNVIAIDDEYRYALVAGKSLKYLWILSREKSIPDTIKSQYLQLAESIGYATDELLWVAHDRDDNPYLNEE